MADIIGGAALSAFIVLCSALFVGPSIWGLADLSKIPASAWPVDGRRKRWTLLFVAGLWVPILGPISALVYARRVRPSLLRNAPATSTHRAPRRSPVPVLIAAFILVEFAGTFAYTMHTHEPRGPAGRPIAEFQMLLDDPELVRRADSVCAAARRVLRRPPPLPEKATFERRARRVERATRLVARMVRKLRRLEAAGQNDAYDFWIENWNRYNASGRAYADAIRTGDPAIYEPAGNAGDAPNTAVNLVAGANGMSSCIF